jgi:hypothetical protein
MFVLDIELPVRNPPQRPLGDFQIAVANGHCVFGKSA